MNEPPDRPAHSPADETSAQALEVQARILRAMPAWRKLELVEDANRTARRLALAGIRLRHPGASDAECFRRLMDIELGEELAERVYGSRPFLTSL